jgi:hypothetical protein
VVGLGVGCQRRGVILERGGVAGQVVLDGAQIGLLRRRRRLLRGLLRLVITAAPGVAATCRLRVAALDRGQRGGEY